MTSPYSSDISQVSAADVISMAQSFANARDEFQGYYTSATGIQQTVATHWTGPSSVIFGEAMTAWERNLNVIIGKVENMSNQLNASAGHYDSHDSVAASNASRLNSMADQLGMS